MTDHGREARQAVALTTPQREALQWLVEQWRARSVTALQQAEGDDIDDPQLEHSLMCEQHWLNRCADDLAAVLSVGEEPKDTRVDGSRSANSPTGSTARKD